ncbi:MAG TPA: hypothetical protein VJZ00_06480 [Thermoanaerobaculia bacterium]|nr:hypothetical protein [Thermoanaerobaculia bacterium]
MTNERSLYNLRVVTPWPDTEWSKWLLRAFHENDARPLRIASREDMASDLEELFQDAPSTVRVPMHRGLVDALRMWDEGFHGRGTLIELAWLAGKIRAIYTIPVLLKILVDNRERLRFEDPFFGAADIVLAAILGFALDEEKREESEATIEEVCDGLFDDDNVAPHFSATLALIITICNRSRFVEVFNRFVERQAKVEDYFEPADVMASFDSHLTTKTLKAHLDELSDEAYHYAAIAGEEAELWTRQEILGDLEKKSGQRATPQKEPREREYEIACRRFTAAIAARRKNKTYVLYDVKAQALTQKRPRGRGHA